MGDDNQGQSPTIPLPVMILLTLPAVPTGSARWLVIDQVLSEMDFVYVKVILMPVLRLEEVSLVQPLGLRTASVKLMMSTDLF